MVTLEIIPYVTDRITLDKVPIGHAFKSNYFSQSENILIKIDLGTVYNLSKGFIYSKVQNDFGNILVNEYLGKPNTPNAGFTPDPLLLSATPEYNDLPVGTLFLNDQDQVLLKREGDIVGVRNDRWLSIVVKKVIGVLVINR